MKLYHRSGWGWMMGFGCVALGATVAVNGQVLQKNKAQNINPAPATAPVPAGVPAAGVAPVPGPSESAGEIRREGRQEGREARVDARLDGAAGPVARDAARETRQQTRQNIQATRAADYGIWFTAGGTGGNRGLIIDDLTDNGMFATAGFRAGDQVVSVNGQAVTSEAQFVQLLAAQSNQPIEIIVMRSGQRQTLVLQSTALTQGVVNYDPLYQYGIVVDDRTPNQIVVQRVYPRTPAYYAGLRQGDVITTFGGQRIVSVDAFTRSLIQTNNAIDLGITRGGQTRQIQLDAANVNVEGTSRTSLRPNFDADARIDARTDTRESAANATQVDRTQDARPGQPRAGDAPNTPRRADGTAPPADAAPRAPRTGDAPRTDAPRAGDAPQRSENPPQRPNPPSGTTPATPANPGVAPATPATPATPAKPVTPAPAPGAPKGAK